MNDKNNNLYEDEEFKELRKEWFEEIKAICASSEFQKANDNFYRDMTRGPPLERLFRSFTI